MKIYVIPFHVVRMNTSIMPDGISGAYVSCYASGSDYTEAVSKALKKLSEDGLYPKEILQPIHEIDAENWSQHIIEFWPEQANLLLSQTDFEDIMKRGGVVYGPFGSYTT